MDLLKRTVAVLTLLMSLVTVSSAQEKKTAEKLLELPKVTQKIARKKLVPIWEAHKCEGDEFFYVVIYARRAEFKRQIRIIAESVGKKCSYSGLRIVFLDAKPRKDNPPTTFWRVFRDGESAPVLKQ